MIDGSHLLRPPALAASIASVAFGAPGAAEPFDCYARLTEAAPMRCPRAHRWTIVSAGAGDADLTLRRAQAHSLA